MKKNQANSVIMHGRLGIYPAKTCPVGCIVVYFDVEIRKSAVTIKTLHEPNDNLYSSWAAVSCIQEVERLRREYNKWKYQDAEPRLQRIVTIIQQK